MSAIREKLRLKVVNTLDLIENNIKEQLHLKDATCILEQLESIENLYSVLTEDEKEFISAVRYAIDKKIKWEY